MGVGVLASGSGTILAALIGAGLPVRVVVADRPCRALAVAEEAGVAAVLVARTEWGAGFDRVAYTEAVVGALSGHDVDVVAMAGWGTVLERPMFDAWPGRVLNTHPALLPAFPGWHAVEEALAAGVAATGCTIHVATAEVDDGPVLAQEEVPVLEGDTVASLHERIKAVERRLYPAVVARLLAQPPATDPRRVPCEP
ncbi:MAG: phosphoribosylglycinamide formyltransferase [Acidimicrobiales bacterium]